MLPKGPDAPPARLPDALSGTPPHGPEPRLTAPAEPPKTEQGSPLSRWNDRTPDAPARSPAAEARVPRPATGVVQASRLHAAAGETPAPQEPAPTPTVGSSPPADAQQSKQVSTESGGDLRLVNSRRIMLDYDLAEIPKPDQTVLELWFTQDGHNWEHDKTALKSGSPYMIEVNREGTYGFILLARRVGEKSEAPAPGDKPQVWVKVDWTKPVVQLMQARPVGDAVARQLAVAWVATDNNLAAQPITLSWAESADGPWYAFATQIENSGHYIWPVPGNVPARVYLRVEAVDLVGNVGTTTTPTPVSISGGGR